MPNEPKTGNSTRRQGATPTGYSRIPVRSVNKMKVTTANPVNAPITSAKTRKIWSSRCRNSARRSSSEFLHQLLLVAWTLSLIPRDAHPEHTSPALDVWIRATANRSAANY